LLRAFGRPLVTTTAHDVETGDPLGDARAVKDAYGHGLEMVLDGGDLEADLSTVISLLEDQLEIVRQGKGELE
jgi:tRNA A37 threonylcarbamoyladenosine synthetase subunit TsaC/SUA5/YrdC